MASSVVSRSGGEAGIQLSGPCGGSQARVADLELREAMAIHAKNKCTYYKNLLQELAQGNKLSLPQYNTESKGDPHRYDFISTVKVGGKLFRSHRWHSRRKDAELDAAKVAYESLVTGEDDDPTDADHSTDDDDPTDADHPADDDDPTDADDNTDVLGLIDQDVMSCTSILHEFAVKTKATQPLYSVDRPEGPLAPMNLFVSSVLFAGITYPGEAATNKKKAKQKAARLAVKSILAANNKCLKKIIRSKKQQIIAITSAFNKERAVSQENCNARTNAITTVPLIKFVRAAGAACATTDQGTNIIPAAGPSAQAISSSKNHKNISTGQNVTHPNISVSRPIEGSNDDNGLGLARIPARPRRMVQPNRRHIGPEWTT